MSSRFKSIKGRFLGLSATDRVNALNGFVSGSIDGPQFGMLVPPNPDYAVFFDDFLGDVVADEWAFAEGSDSGTSDGAISAAVGGRFLLTPGDSAGTVAADYAQLSSLLQWKANAGSLVFQTRVQLAAITSVSTFIGLTDTLSLEQPIYSAGSADTITTDADDAVGFFFDTAQATDVWFCAGVKATVDATHVQATVAGTAVAPVAATDAVLRIEIDILGNAKFYYNGAQCGYVANAVTPTVALTPHFGVRPKSAVAGKTLSIDYSYVASLRV
jgi:hypothetical protein